MNVMQNITKKRDLPEGLENLSKRGPKNQSIIPQKSFLMQKLILLSQ